MRGKLEKEIQAEEIQEELGECIECRLGEERRPDRLSSGQLSSKLLEGRDGAASFAPTAGLTHGVQNGDGYGSGSFYLQHWQSRLLCSASCRIPLPLPAQMRPTCLGKARARQRQKGKLRPRRAKSRTLPLPPPRAPRSRRQNIGRGRASAHAPSRPMGETSSRSLLRARRSPFLNLTGVKGGSDATPPTRRGGFLEASCFFNWLFGTKKGGTSSEDACDWLMWS